MSGSRNIFDPNLICPLCGLDKAQHNGKKYIHREHIPPQNVFTAGSQNLITVPSCNTCNAGTSGLDEKFKVSMGIYLGHKAPELWAGTLKTLNHPPKKNYKQTLLKSISPVLTPFRSSEWRHRLPIDTIPIKTAATKITRGLHWHITNEVVPSTAKISISFIKQEENCHPEVRDILNKHGKWLSTGNEAFQAQYGVAIDKKYASLWLLRFYNEDCFLTSIT